MLTDRINKVVRSVKPNLLINIYLYVDDQQFINIINSCVCKQHENFFIFQAVIENWDLFDMHTIGKKTPSIVDLFPIVKKVCPPTFAVHLSMFHSLLVLRRTISSSLRYSYFLLFCRIRPSIHLLLWKITLIQKLFSQPLSMNKKQSS